jgi:hypothetical protein
VGEEGTNDPLARTVLSENALLFKKGPIVFLFFLDFLFLRWGSQLPKGFAVLTAFRTYGCICFVSSQDSATKESLLFFSFFL